MPSSATDVWQRAMSALRGNIPERTIENWLVDAVPESIDDTSSDDSSDRVSFVLRVSLPFCREYILSNFRSEIEKALAQVLNRGVELTVNVDSSIESSSQETSSEGQEGTSATGKEAAPSSAEASTPDADDANGSASSSEEEPDRRTGGDTAPSTQAADRASTPPAQPDSSSRKPAPFSAEGVTAAQESASQASPGTVSGATVDRDAGPAPSREDPSHQERREKRKSSSGTGHVSFSEQEQHLRPEFTFENFLEGDSNELARSASMAVAQEPGGTKYNPLVVYGEVGLGKTHLAQAIANYSLEHDTANTICYVSSERFTSQFVTAIREDNSQAFSDHYRRVDLLIVDDVQFFGGKEKTQEEFFHLFNDLHQNGKQIVLCADRPPKKIAGIEDRLLSRFQWGLTADIQRPDLEMRMAVLQLKADQLDLEVEPKVLEILAQNITENIRQLEGALKQLSARESLINGNIDVEVVRDVLEREYGLGTATKQPEVEDIIKGVTVYYSLSKDDLVSRNRTKEVSNARQVAMYICREMTGLSYSSIGLRFGGRDHSTVIHACNKVEDQLEVQQGFDQKLEEIRSTVRRQLRSQ